MKVLHIIPSAFNYFDDIRVEAFRLLENLQHLGVEGDAFTLQYGSSGSAKQFQKGVHEIAPSRSFVGTAREEELIRAFADYDLIHLHCPFFGAAGSIGRWKRAHPEIPLIATYHRPVLAADLFGRCIRWYNYYYLPKIFLLADLVAYNPGSGVREIVKRYVKDPAKLAEVDASANFFGTNLTAKIRETNMDSNELLALKYRMLYNELIGRIS